MKKSKLNRLRDKLRAKIKAGDGPDLNWRPPFLPDGRSFDFERFTAEDWEQGEKLNALFEREARRQGIKFRYVDDGNLSAVFMYVGHRSEANDVNN